MPSIGSSGWDETPESHDHLNIANARGLTILPSTHQPFDGVIE